MRQKMLRLTLYLVFLVCAGTPTGSQSQYEAFQLTTFSRESCTQDACEVRGTVDTVSVQSQDSAAAKVAVYGMNGDNGAMQLLGISSVTRASPHSDSWKVKFRLQDAQTMVLLYIRRTTSNRSVRLVPSEGQNTRKFLMGAPDPCTLCANNASEIPDVTVRISSFNTATPAASDGLLTVSCSGGSTVPCPETAPTSGGDVGSSVNEADSIEDAIATNNTAAEDPINDPVIPGHSRSLPAHVVVIIVIAILAIVIGTIIITAIVIGIIVFIRSRHREKIDPDRKRNSSPDGNTTVREHDILSTLSSDYCNIG